MGATEDVASFAVDTRPSDLPAEVLHEAQRDVINLLGCAIYASRDPSLAILLDLFAAEGGVSGCRIWGTDRRVAPLQASLANGYLGHLDDYDDTHFPTILHPS